MESTKKSRLLNKVRNFFDHRSIDMTKGKPTKLLLAFAIPLLLGNILQQFYNIVDTLVVGRFVGENALAAVGASFPLMMLFGGIIFGLGSGHTVSIAQFYGSKDIESIQKVVDTFYKVLIIVATCFSAIAIIFAPQMMQLLSVPAESMDMAVTFFRIIGLWIIPSSLFVANSSLMRGLGDSISSLVFLSASVVTNIILDILFVAVFKWGVVGAAAATVISSSLSVILGFWQINKNYSFFKLRIWGQYFDPLLLKQIMKIGLPSSMQSMLFSFGALSIQRLINSFGVDFAAGFAIAMKIDTMMFYPITSVAEASVSFVSQNFGAGKIKRIKSGLKTSLKMMLAAYCTMVPLLLLAAPHLIGIFTPSTNMAVIEAGLAYLYRVVPFTFILATMFIFSGAMRAVGQSLLSMLATVVSLWGLRVPFSYILAHYFGRDNMYFSWVLGWIVGVIILLLSYRYSKWEYKDSLVSSYYKAKK